MGDVRVLDLDGPVDPVAVSRATEDLRQMPGVGAVVVRGSSGRPAAVVTWEALAAKAKGDGLAPLQQRLTALSYRLVDDDLQPWGQDVPAASLRRTAGRVRNVVRVPLRQRAASTRRRWRRRRFLLQLRKEAWLSGSDLTLSVAKDLYVEPGIRLQMGPVPARLEIGPRCRLLGGSVLRLRGELLVGPGAEIRHDATLNVKGRLELQGRNVFGKGAMVHADGHMVFGWGACLAEYAMVLDTHHERDGSHVHMLDQGVEAREVRMGAGSFVGAKGSVMPGVTVGEGAVVGAASVATRDVPDWTTVVGTPARSVQKR